MKDIFIIVVTFNSADFIERSILNIKTVISLSRLIIIDNNSSDRTVSIVKKYKQVILIENFKNLGYGEGNNLGIDYALKHKAEYVFIVNPDIYVYKEALRKLLEHINIDKKIGIIGPLILDSKKRIWSKGGEVDKKRFTAGLIDYKKKVADIKEEIKDVDFLSGTAFLVKREVFKEIGKFSLNYFLYYEDVDFCFRAKQAGFRVCIDTSAKIIHHASSTVGVNSPLMQYYLARNHFLFVENFASSNIKLREFIRLPKTLFEARKRKYELLGIRDYFFRRFYKKDFNYNKIQ